MSTARALPLIVAFAPPEMYTVVFSNDPIFAMLAFDGVGTEIVAFREMLTGVRFCPAVVLLAAKASAGNNRVKSNIAIPAEASFIDNMPLPDNYKNLVHWTGRATGFRGAPGGLF
jgi:hypothetical protein